MNPLSPHLRLHNDALSHQVKAGVLPVERPAPREKKPGGLKRSEMKRRPPKRERGQHERDAIYTYACLDLGEIADCWLAQFTDTPCDGKMTKVHLVSKQDIRKEIWNPVFHGRPPEPPEGFPARLRDLYWDARCWRPGCWGHHQMLDMSKRIRLGREDLPAEVEEFAAEYGIEWVLEKRYGPLPTLAGGS